MIRRFLVVLLVLSGVSCDEQKRARIGDPCATDEDCESLVCDPDLAKCAEPSSCKSDSMCEDIDPCTKDFCHNGKCMHEQTCQSSKTCRCQDEGVRLEPDPCDWSDATKCSAWTSIQHVLGGDPDAPFNDGTRACWTDESCCLVIRCP